MFVVALSHAVAQGTAFTYQGRLTDGGSPANGTYDFRSGLYNTNTGGTVVAGLVTNPAVVVSNGLFTLSLDFSNVFDGTTYWLQISVRTNGGGAFTPLLPRQELTPAPYAIFAEGASATGLTGTVPAGSLSGGYGGVVSFTNPGDTFSGNGSGLANVNAATLNGLAASNFWQLGGNTISGASQFLGTLNNQPMDLVADGVRALRLILRNDATGQYSNAPNVIGGSSVNLVKSSVVGGTVGGGGGNDTNAVAYPNQVNANFGTISGGASNDVTSLGVFSFIGGGQGNVVNQGYAVLGGGLQNIASNAYTVVGGGFQNSAGGPGATVGGGALNVSSSVYTTVSGGVNNTASGTNEGYATVGGGYGNQAGGDYSFVGGGAQNIVVGAGSVIAGGGFDGTYILGNAIYDDSAIIGGGINNVIFPGGTSGFIGGGSENWVSGNSAAVAGGVDNNAGGKGAFIGGGGYDGTQIYGNSVQANAATIAGGLGNTIPLGARYAVIAGGYFNTNSGYAATLSGGYNNNAHADGAFIGGGGYHDSTEQGGNTVNGAAGTIGGGIGNFIKSGGEYGFIGGGYFNTNSGLWATVGGGVENTASGLGATVAGGELNEASGDLSFAGGLLAKAAHNGSFVWADAYNFNFSSTANNVFFARCTGGVKFVTAIDLLTGNETAGVKVAAGGTSWSAVCDRNAKKNFQAVDTVGVLNKLAAIPIQQWNYKWEANSDTPNLGPMAQDFKAAFYPGRDDKSISTLEFDGVELAAIQGLNQKVELETAALRTENAELKRQNEALEKRLEAVEQFLRRQEAH